MLIMGNYFIIKKKIRVSLLLIFILILIFLNISYTPDLINYKNSYYDTRLSSDILYTLLSKVGSKLGFHFEYFYKTYILLLLLSIIIVLYLYKADFNFVIINLFIFNLFYPIVQIRYYLSFYLFLIYMKVTKKRFKILILILSICSHKAIIVLYGIYYLQKIWEKIIKKNKIILIILFNIGIYIFFKLATSTFFDSIEYFKKFKVYLYDDYSLAGKLYLIILYLLWLIYLKVILRNIEDKNFKDMIYIPFYFFSFSIISVQVIYRYMIPFQFLILLYLSSYYKTLKNNNKKIFLILTCLISMVTFYWCYILPINLGKKSDFIELEKTYISIFR